MAALLGAATAYGLALLQPMRYEAATSVFLDDPNVRPEISGASSQGDPARFLANSVELARSKEVARGAFTALAPPVDFEVFQERYDVEAGTSNADTFEVRSRAATPEEAVATGAGVVDAYRALALEANTSDLQALRGDSAARLEGVTAQDNALREAIGLRAPTFLEEQTLERNARDLETIQSQIAVYEQQVASIGDGVRFVDSPVPPRDPVQPRPLLVAVLGGVLTLLAGGALALYRSDATRTVDNRNDAAALLGAPLLGEIPEFGSSGVAGSTPAASAPLSEAGEAYRFLVASLLFTLSDTGHMVAISSAAPGDGKSVTTLNLALTLAQDDQSVVLVDADARVRGLTRLLDVDSATGLSELGEDGTRVGDATTRTDVDGTAVTLVAAGTGLDDPASYFRSASFRSALARVRKMADLVLIDTPPLLSVAETSAIAGQADGLVIVVSRGTQVRVIKEAAQRLSFVGTPLLGYVYNRGRPSRGRYGYGYGYGAKQRST